MQLSIILPMYNVAPYVDRCIRSLEDQDIPKEDYEIICVNDGSPDNCREVVEGLQQEFGNIVLINQQNQGVSVARNNGMDRASGMFLLFIDPDDYVDASSFARVLKTAEDHDAQVSFLGFTFLNVDGSIRKAVLNEEEKEKVYPGTKAYFVARHDRLTDPDRMWAVLFEREFIEKHALRYLPGVPYLEDGEFIARIMCLAERCIFDGHSFYQRTSRPGSATNSKLILTPKAKEGFMLAAKNLIYFKESHNLSQPQRNFLNQPIAKFILLNVMIASTFNKHAEFKLVRETLILRGLNHLDLEGCDPIYSRFGVVFNNSLNKFYYFWILRRFLQSCKNLLTFNKLFLLDKLYSALNFYNYFVIRK